MSNVTSFKQESDYQYFLESVKTSQILGEGSEGVCYRGKDGFAYKDLDYSWGTIEDIDYNMIITESDFVSKYFYFPIELYTVNNKLRGYKTRCFLNNLFTSEFCEKDLMSINERDFLNAYYLFQREIEELSKEQIVIDDLPANLLFNGKIFVAIDTCGYYRTQNPDDLKRNDKMLNRAIKSFFNSFLYVYGKKKQKLENIEDYLKLIKRQFDDSPKTKSVESI